MHHPGLKEITVRDAKTDYDLFVIGGGSGGVRAARMASQRGARVALAEAAALGGTCVNVGCIPKKLYSYAAHFSQEFEDAVGYGWQAAPRRFDWGVLKARRAREIARLNSVYRKLLVDGGVTVINGWARLKDGHTVDVRTATADVAFTAAHILIATGATPSVPSFPGNEHAVSSDAMFDLDPFPARLAVLGGGYIACEFASIFNGMGAQVTQLYRGQQVLRGFDQDVRRFITQELRETGIDLRVGSDVKAIRRVSSGLEVLLAEGGVVGADVLLCATGRVPNVSGLGLRAAGVATSANGAIIVDERFDTSIPSIHALGDVTARVQLTPVALAEAGVLVERLFGSGRGSVNYELVPTAVFTQPNVAAVGYTEEQAREKFSRIAVFRTEFKPLKHQLSGRNERAFLKLIVDSASDRVVGLHMVGADAGEIVQGFSVALNAGATKQDFDRTLGIHPTVAEEFVTMRTPVSTE